MTTEQDNIEAYKAAKAMGEDSHWERGRLALEWVEKYARGRSGVEYAKMVGESQQSVSEHMRVSREFTVRTVDLSWSHHRCALEETETPQEARAWLEQAARQELSVAQMVECIRASHKKPEGESVQDDSPEFIVETLRRSLIKVANKWPDEHADKLAKYLREFADRVEKGEVMLKESA